MPKLMTFKAAVKDAKAKGYARSVLLGNGFSMAYNPQVFGYDSLAKEARLTGLSVQKSELFEQLGSTNFEVIIEMLTASAKMQRLYCAVEGCARAMEADATTLRRGLAEVLADRHPGNNFALTDEEIRHARTFLSNFRQLFTLSYDLLLYWAVNRADVGPRVPMTDGFEYATVDQRDDLIWKANPTQGRQRVFFLHGALHLFVDEDKRVHKLSWGEHGSLVPEIRRRLDRGMYPLIVTEGRREEKEARIDRSAYLRTAHRRFANIEGALFVHGVSMSPNDDHIFEPVADEQSRIVALYVGVRGSINSANGRELARRAEGIADERKAAGGKKLEVEFYDADSAHVWR